MGLKIDYYMKRKQYRYTNEIFIEKAKETHGDRYDYSNTNYVNKRTKVRINCRMHGEFLQLPMNHIRGQGCPECGKIIAQKREMQCKNKRKTNEEFQKDVDKLYNGRYEVIGEYVNNKTKILIYCHNKNKDGKEHGEFLAKPNDIICGHGCHKCIHSKLEDAICDFLNNNNISYEHQKRFQWFGRQSVDFYLPEYNVAIECQGKQHFKPVDFNGEGNRKAEEKFLVVVENDKKKRKLCQDNRVKLLYYTDRNNYNGEKYEYNLFFNTNDLLNEILKCKENGRIV